MTGVPTAPGVPDYRKGGQPARTRVRARAGLILAALLWASAALAVQPDEVLPDPVLEARARALSRELRCVVCRTENIDDSDAAIARDLRLLVRERLVAGDTDAQVMAFMVDRFGEYVLLNPPVRGANLMLWLAGPAFLLLGGGIAVAFLRRRAVAPDQGTPLSDDEEARLSDLLGK